MSRYTTAAVSEHKSGWLQENDGLDKGSRAELVIVSNGEGDDGDERHTSAASCISSAHTGHGFIRPVWQVSRPVDRYGPAGSPTVFA